VSVVSVHPISTAWSDGLAAVIGFYFCSYYLCVIFSMYFLIDVGKELQTGVTIGKIFWLLLAIFIVLFALIALVSPPNYC
jgi:hypothetical protein